MTQLIDTTTKTTPRAMRLLKKHGISLRGLARGLDMSPDTVRFALNPTECGSVTHINTVRIRARVEALLKAANENTGDLWDEYDSPLDEVA